MVISLPERISGRFGQSIAFLALEVLEPINLFHLENEFDSVTVDVSPCKFITPLIATPLACLRNRYESERRDFDVNCDDDADFFSYGNIIHFPIGLRPEQVVGESFEQYLHKYRTKTYFPIINFPALRTGPANAVRDNALQAIHNLLDRQLNLSTNFRTAVYYLIDELVNNVKDHSGAERGFIFAQYYPEGRFLDICIVDDGIGILNSYRAHGITKYTSHAQAIHAAVNGASTKNYEGGRGFGINTSLRMLVDGLGGNFLLMSGNAHIIGRQINEIPYSMSWKGTLIGLRVPFTQKEFNHGNYLE